jgi:general stress protein 26
MKNYLKDSKNEKFKNIAKIIEDVGVCMLTTLDHAGRASSRPMYVQELDEDGSLWFFSSSKAHLIQEIIGNPVLNITFADSSKNEFLSASAIAYEVFDRSKIEELWHPSLKVWYKDGIESKDLLLLKVDMQEIEYWDSPTSAVVKIEGLISALTGNQSPMGSLRHERIDLNF